MCPTTANSKRSCDLPVFVLALLTLILGPDRAYGQSPTGLKVERSDSTGLAIFVTGVNGAAVPVQTPAGRAAPTPMDFLIEHGSLFGVTEPDLQLVEDGVEADTIGFVHTTYRQSHQGVPVFGGTLKVHQDSAGQIRSANGHFHPISPKLGVNPALTSTEAEAIARGHIDGGQPAGERSELVIVDPGWYGDPAIGARLAYYVVLSDPDAVIREGFFVDAHTGRVLDQWTMIHTVRRREVYDGRDAISLPGILVRTEAQGPVQGWGEVNQAFDYAGDSYDYFFRAFGRDSLNGNGMTLKITVNLTGLFCPNAFWNGIQVAVCEGVATDDVIGHELTHGLTQFTADLIYQNQSGQLNESFSDVFGELIDLFNGNAAFIDSTGGPVWPPHPTGPGRDTENKQRNTCSPGHGVDGVRWLVAEDSTGFGRAIRDMWLPTCYNHPDRANSEFQPCGPWDSGGVHSGSGVPNHAFAMLTDGKTFNGQTVEGIGPIKSGAVWYHALAHVLTEFSDFRDAALAFNAAAAALVGTTPKDPRTGLPSDSPFTADDATQVAKTMIATEMNTLGRCGTELDILDTAAAAICDSAVIFTDNFETGSDGWSVCHAPELMPTPYDWTTRTGLPLSRPGTAMFCRDPNSACGSTDESGRHMLVSPPIVIPDHVKRPALSSTHYMSSELGWDGGAVQIKVGTEAPECEEELYRIPRNWFLRNPYNMVLHDASDGNTSPLRGEEGWSGWGGWGTSIVDLSNLVRAGQTMHVVFVFGKDQCAGADGWYVDDVRVYDLAACDCNGNGISDQDEIAGGTSPDCNANGTPDGCEGGCVIDNCPNDPAKLSPSQCGCGVADTDTDADGTADCLDLCPNDGAVKKTNPGICGCGVSDADSDGDGVPDCNDRCPNARDADSDSDGRLDCDDLCPFDAAKLAPGGCGCGQVELDGDGDGAPDCRDLCLDDPDKASPGACGCGVPDTDADGDGVADCNDSSASGMPQALVIDGPDEVMVGESARFVAWLQYADGGSEDVSDHVAWRLLDTVLPSSESARTSSDTLDETGMLTPHPQRESGTTLAVMATFTEGGRKYDDALLVRVTVADEEPGEFVPVDGGAGEPTAGQDMGSAGGSSSGMCGVGLLLPAAVALSVLGLHRRSRRR